MNLVHSYISFWETNKYPYIGVIDLSEMELLLFTDGLKRTDIIEWLVWNDRNGIYSDSDSIREFGEVMSREEGVEIFIRQVEENRTSPPLKIV